VQTPKLAQICVYIIKTNLFHFYNETPILARELNKSQIISTDEDQGLRTKSFAVINLRGVSTNKTIIPITLYMIWRLHAAILQ
jgi:hypothetical protein